MRARLRFLLWIGVSAYLALALAACGGGHHSEPAAAAPSAPGLLQGNDGTQAIGALPVQEPVKAARGDLVSGYLLTRLSVMIAPDATVGQLNAAAKGIGATAIGSSAPSSPLLTLVVPRQPSIAALWQLAQTLEQQPGIVLALPGMQAKSSVLPEASPGVPASPLIVAHLLGNRFPQAWNARQAIPTDCLPRSVKIYVWDQFGDPASRPSFSSAIDPSTFVQDPGGAGPDSIGHGYDTAVVIAGAFGSNPPVGANPFADCTLIEQVEADGYSELDAVRRVMERLANDPGPVAVLNVSMNSVSGGFCGPTGDQACNANSLRQTPLARIHDMIEWRFTLAAYWAKLAQQFPFERKILVSQAVGNVDAPPDDLVTGAAGYLPSSYLGFRRGILSSTAALAGQLLTTTIPSLLTDSSLWKSSTDPSLPDLTFDTTTATAFATSLFTALQLNPNTLPDTTNLLLVDSGTFAEAPGDIRQSDFNFLDADVRAVGENVVLSGSDIRLVNGVETAFGHAGTSLAAPLVAGAISYLWNLAPALAADFPQKTADLILNSAQHTANSPTVPVLDVYAAALVLDDVPGVGTSSIPTPIRLGLVDVNGDGVFDSRDLQMFANAYGLANPNQPSIPSAADFSRFDLNGDGLTGGIPITAFDLDVNGLDAHSHPLLNTVTATIEDYNVSMNEAALSDLQILCYYAYSPLYQIDPQGNNALERTRILGPDQCVRATISVPLPAQISGATTLTTDVQIPAGGGQLAPAPNVAVTFTTTCGTSSPTSGITDANGQLLTTVTPAANCTSVTVQAVARGDANGPVLAQQSVTAAVSTTVHLAGAITSTYHEESYVPCDTCDDGGVIGATFDTSISATARVDVGPSGELSIVDATGSFTKKDVVTLPCWDGQKHTTFTYVQYDASETLRTEDASFRPSGGFINLDWDPQTGSVQYLVQVDDTLNCNTQPSPAPLTGVEVQGTPVVVNGRITAIDFQQTGGGWTETGSLQPTP